jgi:asparagine synthase (glutamine-hydrolysing)
VDGRLPVSATAAVSAICGALGLDGRPYGTRELAGMLGALAGLGPDGAGHWGGRVGAVPVAVGAALRHRVRQDATDRQPVTSVDGRLVVVADAILDNRAELSGLLGVPDRDDVPDSRFVLAAYERWGADCPTRLTGEFAFAAVDTGRGGVLLARDRLGIRPLNVHQRAGVLAFASTALALSEFDGVGREVDVTRVAEYLALIPASERSWLVGIRPVPAATAMWADDRGVRSWRYWEVDPTAIDTGRGARQHVRALRAAFDAAVATRLTRGGPVGVSLSGGLDSTSVAATAAAQLGGEPLHSYTSVPAPGWSGGRVGRYEPDESHLVDELAGWYPNLRTSFVDARGLSFLDGYDETFAAGGTPTRNPCNLTWVRAIHRAAAADGVRNLFTGGAGNVFYSADDPRWLAALLRRGRWHTAGRELTQRARVTDQPLRQVLRSSVLAELVPAVLHDRLRHRQTVERVTGRLRDECGLRAEWQGVVDPVRAGIPVTAAHSRARRQPTDSLASLATYAEFSAAEHARSGLYVADPTVDLRVITASLAQPPWARRHRGMDRAVCRQAMAGRLPDTIRLRTARGAQLPDWLDRLTDARAEFTAELAAARDYPVVRDVIDLDLLDRAVRDWPTPSTAPSPELASRYRAGLLRPLLAARYLRWLTDRSATRIGETALLRH